MFLIMHVTVVHHVPRTSKPPRSSPPATHTILAPPPPDHHRRRRRSPTFLIWQALKTALSKPLSLVLSRKRLDLDVDPRLVRLTLPYVI